MLPARHRMSSSRDFTAAVKGGKRVGRRSMVVHIASSLGPAAASQRSGFVVSEGGVNESESAAGPLVSNPPRVGLIVSKAVGNSVTRHAVSRRLRAAAAAVVDGLDDDALVVIRALRPAADDDSNELASQLRSGLAKLGAL